MATSTTNITNTGIRTSFSNTPQAMDDAYSLTEAGLQSRAYSGISYNDVTHILTLDVMSNDLGGGAKTLFAIDDGNGHTNLTDYDLLTKDTAGVWEASANGNRIQIVDGKINVDISHFLQSVGVASIEALGAGDRIQDEFVYSIRLANGTLSQAKVTIDIQGSNDLAAITGNHAGSVTEDTQLTASGALTVTDADRGENHAQAASGATALGSYSVNADGQWTYAVDNAAVQHLAAGQTASDSFVVKSADGTATETVSITINGTNDAASISGQTSGSVGEDDTAAVNGTIAVNDVDDGEAHAVADAGATVLGSYSVGADGQWSYAVNNEAVQHLAAGQSTTDSFVVKSADGTAAQTVTITINGANDAASMSGDTSGAAGEDDTAALTGAFVVSDVDDGEAHAAAAAGATALGSYSVDANGQWSYSVHNSAVQHLAAGQTASDSFVVHSLDGTAVETVSVTINGANDAASISGQTTGAIGEDDTNVISGLVTVSDADDGQAHALAATGTTALGSYSIDADGHWTYAVDNAAVQSLNAGETMTDSFTIHSLDGSAEQTISLTINGADDSVPHAGPVANEDNWIVSQSTPAVLPLAALFGNDTHAGASYTLTGLSADGIDWTGTSGTTTNGATVALNAAGITVNEGNRTAVDGFWYEASDGQGGTATGHVSIGIAVVQNGANAGDTVNLSAKSYGYSYIDAGEGSDTVTGGSGIDYLVGGSGADVLTGNGGADILTGGMGNDVFKYSALADASDTITDFQINKANGNDALDVHDLLASFSGVDAAHGNAYSGGYLQLSQVANGGQTDTEIWVDADGSSGSGAQVLLATLTDVALTQFDTGNIVL